MNKLLRSILILCFVLSIGCATTQTEKVDLNQTEHEDLSFDIEPEWKVGYSAEIPNQYSIIEFVREGDDINNWKELLTIQNFPPLWGGPSPEDALNKLKAIREKECPEVTKWNVINKDKKSILYEWQAKPCLDWPDQHEIAKMIYGKYNTFILHYVQKMYQMSDEQRTKWITRFSEAEIQTSLR